MGLAGKLKQFTVATFLGTGFYQEGMAYFESMPSLQLGQSINS